MKPGKTDYLTITEMARRSGVAASALRFYEQRQLIHSERSSGNHRIYHRSMLRRVGIIRVAQSLGLSLREVSEALSTLPNQRTPTRRDWQKLSSKWRQGLNQRIQCLERLRDQLSGCIGCGCLSMKRCQLYNANDKAGDDEAGPRFLLDDQ